MPPLTAHNYSDYEVQDEVDYKNRVVKKPWGYEYLIFENEHIGVWFLAIDYNCATSLHCHPKKKTGLLLLEGEAEVSFLNGSKTLTENEKLMIRPGLFHSTKAQSKSGIKLIEIETPRDKGDLVRLDDYYGREQKPYESGPAITHNPGATCWLTQPSAGTSSEAEIENCKITLQTVTDKSSFTQNIEDKLIAILDGGLETKNGEPIVAPGDIVTGETLARLAPKFEMPKATFVFTVHAPANALVKKG